MEFLIPGLQCLPGREKCGKRDKDLGKKLNLDLHLWKVKSPLGKPEGESPKMRSLQPILGPHLAQHGPQA